MEIKSVNRIPHILNYELELSENIRVILSVIVSIQAGVNSFSTVVVEGNSAAGNVDNLVYSVMNAFYIACSSFVGQNYGAGKSTC